MVNVKSICETFFSILLLFLFFVTQACSSEPESNQEMSKHHTTKGFRNYPIVEEAPALGLSFYWGRFIASLSIPDVPKSHFLTEEKAMALFKRVGSRAGLLRSKLSYAEFLTKQGQIDVGDTLERETYSEANRIGLFL